MSSAPELHPLLDAAAGGSLPEWACAGGLRRQHMARVARLLVGWAESLGLPPREQRRWAAAGWLHDVLRESPAQHLRSEVPPEFRELAPSVLHGPAGAVRLREEGVDDLEFLAAVAYHTLGHRDFGLLGRALYAADFLEPGRRLRPRWRAALRRRMPGDLNAVVREILASRIAHLVGRGSPIRSETMEFWNVLAGEGPPGERP